MYATYFVPQNNAPRLKEKLEKMSRKAVKLGCAAIMITLAKVFSAPHPDRDRARDGERLVYEALTIQGEPPKLNGWVFAAALDHEVGKDGRPVNILRSHGEETLPHRFRTATPDNCDHCHTYRRRNNTFVVRHEESGEWKQVGRSCLKDFLGYHKDPGVLARYAAVLLELDTVIREECEGSYGANGYLAYDLGEFLAYTVESIKAGGWVSRTMARESNVMATADAVLGWLSVRHKPGTKEYQAYQLPQPNEATLADVEAALKWLAEQDGADNDYIHNCQVIQELGCVNYKTAGYAASIVSSYWRAKERDLRRVVLKADGDSYVGTVGKREDLRLTVLGCHTFEGYYGMTYLYRFADPEGNAVVWFASSEQDLVQGASYKVKATVKRHEEYKGQPQTQVNRLTVQPLTKPKKQRKQRVKKAS
jgi:hypothetical protein